MQPLTKNLLWIVPAFVAGVLLGLYGLGRSSGSGDDWDQLRQQNAELQAALDSAKSERSHLQTELSRIASVDLADYLRLRKEEEQFQKSREILGKIFMVLFHNLLQGVPEDQVEFARSAAGTSTEGTAASEPTPETISESQVPAPAPEKSSIPTPEAQATKSGATWVQAEKDFGQLNLHKAESFLQSTAIQDVASESTGFRKFNSTDTRIAALQGTFTGDIVFLDPKRKPWNLEMTLNSETKDGIPSGQFIVRIVDDKGNPSTMSGNGDVRAIVKPVSSSKALIVRITETRYLQMYILERQEIIIGNYYDEVQVGKVERVGSFRLQR
ncbi:MAG TPA: hypothetical protein VE954_34360 [Oligoflexus sp.]|uniref:hypothetical protein n=1 Tax=Oligoflexus sp. TaxID=1971216 RepID=UPI002D4A3B28|nr:hypothetical protein [Oligoflexus sp.]HYX38213.1 hypothetical protein [Oligoflexus sp.]